jgi:hypothetical protein
MATAELALALVALSVVAQFLLVGGTVLAAQLQASDAARVSARLAARGENNATIARAVHDVAPRANFEITRGDGIVRSTIHMAPPGRLAKVFISDVSATARSVDEVSAGAPS